MYSYRGGVCMSGDFYEQGLRFSCTKCGKCCTGSPGRVRVSREERQQLAALRGVTEEDFTLSFTRQDGRNILLTEKENGDCIFYDNGCTVYHARPLQCRLFPFWFRNLRNENAWLEAAKDCPGIGQGRLYTKEEIFDLVGQDIDNRGRND